MSTASHKASLSALSVAQSQVFADPLSPHRPPSTLGGGGACGVSRSLSYQRPWGASTVIFSHGLINPDSCELDPRTEASS